MRRVYILFSYPVLHSNRIPDESDCGCTQQYSVLGFILLYSVLILCTVNYKPPS